MVSRERGLALVAVITVLVALVLVATTYMMLQQDQEQRSRGQYARKVAEQEVSTVLNMTIAMLQRTTDGAERDALAAGSGDGSSRRGTTRWMSSPFRETSSDRRIPAVSSAPSRWRTSRGRST
jgi:hypothetical protein